jgi:hypothetical protein
VELIVVVEEKGNICRSRRIADDSPRSYREATLKRCQWYLYTWMSFLKRAVVFNFLAREDPARVIEALPPRFAVVLLAVCVLQVSDDALETGC